MCGDCLVKAQHHTTNRGKKLCRNALLTCHHLDILVIQQSRTTNHHDSLMIVKFRLWKPLYVNINLCSNIVNCLVVCSNKSRPVPTKATRQLGKIYQCLYCNGSHGNLGIVSILLIFSDEKLLQNYSQHIMGTKHC